VAGRAYAKLTPSETAEHQAERKAVYLRMHPATKRGGAPGAGKGKGKKNAIESCQVGIFPSAKPSPAYIDDAAKKTGKSKRTVAREVKRGTEIPVTGNAMPRAGVLPSAHSMISTLRDTT
jgi:hypothetical protein